MLTFDRHARRCAYMAAHHAADALGELRILTVAEYLPGFLVEMTIERLGEYIAKMNAEVEAMRAAIGGQARVSETAVWPKTSEERV